MESDIKEALRSSSRDVGDAIRTFTKENEHTSKLYLKHQLALYSPLILIILGLFSAMGGSLAILAYCIFALVPLLLFGILYVGHLYKKVNEIVLADMGDLKKAVSVAEATFENDGWHLTEGTDLLNYTKIHRKLLVTQRYPTVSIDLQETDDGQPVIAMGITDGEHGYARGMRYLKWGEQALKIEDKVIDALFPFTQAGRATAAEHREEPSGEAVTASQTRSGVVLNPVAFEPIPSKEGISRNPTTGHSAQSQSQYSNQAQPNSDQHHLRGGQHQLTSNQGKIRYRARKVASLLNNAHVATDTVSLFRMKPGTSRAETYRQPIPGWKLLVRRNQWERTDSSNPSSLYRHWDWEWYVLKTDGTLAVYCASFTLDTSQYNRAGEQQRYDELHTELDLKEFPLRYHAAVTHNTRGDVELGDTSPDKPRENGIFQSVFAFDYVGESKVREDAPDGSWSRTVTKNYPSLAAEDPGEGEGRQVHSTGTGVFAALEELARKAGVDRAFDEADRHIEPTDKDQKGSATHEQAMNPGQLIMGVAPTYDEQVSAHRISETVAVDKVPKVARIMAEQGKRFTGDYTTNLGQDTQSGFTFTYGNGSFTATKNLAHIYTDDCLGIYNYHLRIAFKIDDAPPEPYLSKVIDALWELYGEWDSTLSYKDTGALVLADMSSTGIESRIVVAELYNANGLHSGFVADCLRRDAWRQVGANSIITVYAYVEQDRNARPRSYYDEKVAKLYLDLMGIVPIISFKITYAFYELGEAYQSRNGNWSSLCHQRFDEYLEGIESRTRE